MFIDLHVSMHQYYEYVHMRTQLGPVRSERKQVQTVMEGFRSFDISSLLHLLVTLATYICNKQLFLPILLLPFLFI